MVYGCYWCRIDQQCHHKGSMITACFRAWDDSCVSLSMLMSCDYKSDGMCPPPDGHMSPFQTCDERISMSQQAGRLNADPWMDPAAHERMVAAREQVSYLGIHEDHTGEVPLMILMQMANDVYQLGDHPEIQTAPPEGWIISYQEQQPDWGTTVYKEVALAIYERGNQAVLVFKGTSLDSSLTDIAMDLQDIIGGNPPVGPILLAGQLIKDLQQKGFTVLVTGHSLGGYISEVIATTFGLAGAGFCVPGPGWHNGFKGGAASGYRNVNFVHDVAGNVLAGIFLHAQWSVYVQDWDGYQHMPDKMLKSMKARGSEWTNQNVACKCSSSSTGFYTNFPVSAGSAGYEAEISV